MATEPVADGSVVVSTIDGIAAVTLSAGQTVFSVLPEAGLVTVIPGLLLTGSLVVKAFAGTANVIVLHGFVNRITV